MAMATAAPSQPIQTFMVAGVPTIDPCPPVTESQFEYTLLTTPSSPKVAIEAAIPDKRMMTRPTISANRAANKPEIGVATHIGNCVCRSQDGNPLSVMAFITGGMVSQAVM